MHGPIKRKSQNRKSRFAGVFEAMEARQMFAAHILGNATNYATIQAAINAAATGATINVDAGTYKEQITITKQLTLRGSNAGIDARGGGRKAEAILTGITTASGVATAVNINASNVTMDGFTVKGQTTKATDTSAGVIIAGGVSGTRFVNNIVSNNVAGLYLANNSDTNPAVIQYNLFKDNNNAGSNGGRGIYTDGGVSGGNLTNISIDSNLFVNNRGGSGTTGLEAAVAIEAHTAGKQSNIRITNNMFDKNGKSVLFFNTTGVLIQGNTAQGAADWYSGSLRFEGNNHDVTIQYNNIINNPGPGVAIDSKGVPGDSSGFVITNNNIYGNGTKYSARPGVVFTQESYVGTFDARNNWWGKATGPSGDGPGTGDAIYGNAVVANAWTFAKGGTELFSPWSTAANPITAPTLPGAPTSVKALASGNSQINLTWTNGTGNPTSIKIERSIDGINFSPLLTLVGTPTSYSDTGLTSGTTYSYRLRSTNVAGDSLNSNIASATTAGVNPVTYLSDLAWVSATTGYGTVHKDASVVGNVLTIGTTSYAKGIGTHAVSTIVYNLGGAYDTFASDAGIDAGVKGIGSVQFLVIGDGTTLFDSGVLTNGQVAKITVPVTGVKTLTLKAVNGIAGTIDFDHADWANARVMGTVTAPAAPANLVATALTATSIRLNWNAGPANLTGYSIDRSIDGTTFTTVASNVLGSATTWTDPAVLSANTQYYYRIRATNAAGTSPDSNIASVTTLASSVFTYLSDLIPTSSISGWGTTQMDKTIVGNTITLRGQTYTKGIGTHAVGTITYNLAGNYSTFLSDIGVDDEVQATGSVIFQVVADGVVIFDSGVLTNNDPVMSVNLNVTGVQTLTLYAKNGIPDDIDHDHADWAGARLS